MKITKTILAALICIPAISFGKVGDESFTKVELNSIGKVFVTQGDSNYVEINTSGSKQGIDTKVKHNTLYIESSVEAEYRITMKTIEGLSVSGTGEIISTNTIVTDHLQLDVSGSGKMTLALQTKDLDVDISGVGKMNLSGKSENANVEISGSGKVEAFDLQVANCKAEISGVGKCNIDVTESLSSEISGMGSVNYKNKPAHVNSEVSGVGNVNHTGDSSSGSGRNDTTRLSLGKTEFLIIQNDSTKEKNKKKRNETSPIWSGLDIGFNNYVNASGLMELPAGNEFLTLNQGKSVFVGLNFLEFSHQFAKSNFWFVTGMGIHWNNYRFDKNVNLVSNADSISGIYDTTSTRNYSKSKLTVTYLTVPIMFEFFTSHQKKHAFHLGAGAMLGYKIGSHSKLKYTTDGATSKPKEYDDFYLNPFRYGARVELGYHDFNVFADYYVSPVFEKKKGPELFPVSIGITLGI